ncbi:hypothetical protein LP414_27890 [Polaromonas sp. P1(28)-13]|nr:hypothetical protein LP414_27890 [Polaromonas sp. P1(28)-13]
MAGSDFVILTDKFAVAQESEGTTKYPFTIGMIDGVSSIGINANMYVDGTIKTRMLDAEAVTADKIKALTITTDKLAAGAITADKISVGFGGRNMVANCGPTPGSTASFVESGADPLSGVKVGYAPWLPPGGASVYLNRTGIPTGYSDIWNDNYGARYPVIGGARYEFSVYLSMHRWRGYGVVAWYDGSGAYIGETGGSTTTYSGSGALVNWARSVTFATAPANAATAMLIARADTCTAADPYMFTSSWYFGEAGVNQTVPSPYSPAGQTIIDASGIRTPSLSAISANIGLLRTAASGARTEIESNQIRVYDSNGAMRVRLGIW